MKKNLVIIALLTFIIGFFIGFFLQVKSEIKTFLTERKKPLIQSEKLPEPTDKPITEKNVEQLFNIDTTTVKKIKLYKTIETYAQLRHPETDLKDITFKINGYVEKLYADFTGKYVKKGEPLLTVYSPELVSAQEEFIRAYQYYNEMKKINDPVLKESAKQLLEAAYKKLRYWDITPEQIEKLKKTKKAIKSITLYSPYKGWIMEKFVYLGSKVKAGEPVLRLAKHKNLWLIAKIYQEDTPFIKKGQDVEITLSPYTEKLKGKIDYIYPMMDEKERAVDVRIVLKNPEGKFFPGMYGKVSIKIPLGEKLVLPETAVLNTGKRQVVFLEKEKGIFEPVFVKLGVYADGYYEIKEGVQEGMVVANSALFLLDADAQLKGKYRKNKSVINQKKQENR